MNPEIKALVERLEDEETLKELLEMGKSMEDQARKVFMMSEAFAG